MSPPSSQVPYIGSTISLLSKAGIRYEGFLHNIDQSEASVTLDHVRVFGTEDRQCDRRVPPSSEIFEFIIFRASDITELRVIDTPLSRPVPDPAIIRLQSKSAATVGSDAAASADKGGAAVSNGGSSGRRRQARGQSSSGRGRQQRYQQQQHNGGQQQILMQSQQQVTQHQQQQFSPLQQRSMQQQQQQQYQQQRQYRNDWYGGYRGGSGGYYPQYLRAPHAYEFSQPPVSASVGFMAPPSGVFINGGAGNGGNGGGGGGGRPVMHFRRYHGNGNGAGGGGGQRRGGGLLLGGGRHVSRQPWRQQPQSINGGPPAVATKYFASDYDFETANAEMAKLLLTATNSSGVATATTVDAPVSGSAGASFEEAGGKVATTGSSAISASREAAAATRTHVGYDKERSFYDDISRVDAEERTEAGGDSVRIGSGGIRCGNDGGAGGIGGRKDAARQNALNRETFGVIAGVGGRRMAGGRFHSRMMMRRRSPV